MDIWVAKVLPLTADAPQTDAQATGHYFEDGIAQEYADRFDARLHRGLRRVHSRHSHISATPDRIIVEGPPRALRQLGLLECKTVGPLTEHHWDIERRDAEGVPPYYQIQAQQQLAVTAMPFCDIAAKFLVSRRLHVFRIEPNYEQWDAIETALTAFWQDHVIPKLKPAVDGGAGTARMLAEFFPKELAGIAPAPDDALPLVRAHHELGERIAKLARDRARVEHEICELIGDNAGLSGAWGHCTWKQQAGQVDYQAAFEDLCKRQRIAERDRQMLRDVFRGAPVRVYHQFVKGA